jgi:hypothetical protein
VSIEAQARCKYQIDQGKEEKAILEIVFKFLLSKVPVGPRILSKALFISGHLAAAQMLTGLSLSWLIASTG